MDDSIAPLFQTDAYKLDHRRQYPPRTTRVYSNYTNRKSRIPGVNKVVHFGLQAYLQKYLMDAWEPFFNHGMTGEVMRLYKNRVTQILGPEAAESIGADHIGDLHELGYLPLRFCALPEGTLVPIGVPCFTVENTHDDFAWLTNYIETGLSCGYWQPSTSATIAHEYRKILEAAAHRTGANTADVDYQLHDFSYRGMSSHETAAASGAAHLLSFKGTDSLVTLDWIERYYRGAYEAKSVPATEHSCMSAGTAVTSEYETYERLLDLYPTGTLAIVSDTYDLFRVTTEYLPKLKDKILAREGRLTIRPDCYDESTSILTPHGWVMFKDLTDADEVAQVHPDGTYTFVTPLKRTSMDYNGLMVRFADHFGKCDLLVTPNHRMLWKRRRAGNRVIEAGMSTVGNAETKMYRTAAAPERGESLSATDRFRIAFQADGSYPSHEPAVAVSGMRTYRFNFAKKRKTDRLVSICNEGGFRYRVTQEPARVGQDTVYVWLPEAVTITKHFGWVDLGKLCGDWCKEFIEELSYWDACRRHDQRFTFCTTNPAVIDVVEIIALSAGYGVLVSSAEDNLAEHFSDVYTANILKDPMLGSQAIEKQYEWYMGTIHCVTVPSGMLLVKRGRGTAVCGNSGDPEQILCGARSVGSHDPAEYGVVRLLWDLFGGSTNRRGFRELDPHIGVIYGDSITLARAQSIVARLEEMGFASTTVALGVGSFSYQLQTRDTFGSAMKATWALVDGKPVNLFKDPVTDDGTKRSATGRLAVYHDTFGESLELIQDATLEQECDSLLVPVWENGKFLRRQTFEDVRDTLASQRKDSDVSE